MKHVADSLVRQDIDGATSHLGFIRASNAQTSPMQACKHVHLHVHGMVVPFTDLYARDMLCTGTESNSDSN